MDADNPEPAGTGKSLAVVETIERTYFTAVVKGMGRITLFHDSAEDIRAALRHPDPDGFAHVTGWNHRDGVQEVLVRPEAVVYIGDEGKGNPGPEDRSQDLPAGMTAVIASAAGGGSGAMGDPDPTMH